MQQDQIAPSPRPRSPSTVAGWLHKVLQTGAGHLPVLAELGARVYEHTAWRVRKLETALNALHDSVTAVAPTPQEVAEQFGELLDHARQIGIGADQVAEEAQAFVRRAKLTEGELRLVLHEFLLEAHALEEVVERCAPWLEEMQAGLATGEAGYTATLDPATITQLAQQAEGFGRRLALLQAVHRSARNFQALAEKIATTRPELGAAATGEIQRACAQLQGRLEQAYPSGRGMAATMAAVVTARSDAQIWAAQALALVLRLQAAQHRLAREASALKHRCGLLLPLAGEAEALPQDDDVATLH